MTTRMSPKDQVRNSINLFGFSLFLRNAFEEKRMTPALFVQNLRFVEDETDQLFAVVQQRYDHAALDDLSYNVVHAAGGNLAIAIDTALEEKFGTRPKQPVDELAAFRILVYMVRCAYAHDPVHPTWEVRKDYQIQISLPSLGLALDFAKLNGQALDAAHFGGPRGIQKLIDKARALVA